MRRCPAVSCPLRYETVIQRNRGCERGRRAVQRSEAGDHAVLPLWDAHHCTTDAVDCSLPLVSMSATCSSLPSPKLMCRRLPRAGTVASVTGSPSIVCRLCADRRSGRWATDDSSAAAQGRAGRGLAAA